MDKNLSYVEYISEKVNQNLFDYSNYVAQEIDKSLSYTDYLAEKLDSNLKWNKRRESRRNKIKVIFE